jgi:hypothetical protein
VKLAIGRLSPRSLILIPLIAIVAAATLSPIANADEQRVSRLGLGLYIGATSINPKEINNRIEEFNTIITPPPPDGAGLSPVDQIKAAPLIQAEFRFFISDKLVAVGGLGYMERTEQLLLKPQPDLDEVLAQAHVQGVPIYVGLDYYFLPYTSGDVSWRPFAGGGFMTMVESQAKVGTNFRLNPDDPTEILIEDNFTRALGQGAGFYLETGVHLMLPGRWSFLGNVYYRHLKIPTVWGVTYKGEPLVDAGPILSEDGQRAEVDWSGFGIRLGIQLDILDRL